LVLDPEVLAGKLGAGMNANDDQDSIGRQPWAIKGRGFRRFYTLRLLSVLVLVMWPAVVKAQSYTNNYGIWTYTTNQGTITITDYSGPGGAVVIPGEIDGLPITGIGDAVFLDINLTAVTIPNSVTAIGYYAFEFCSELANITIPNSVTNIGYAAFYYCSGLTNVTTGNGVTSIGDSAFEGCVSLSNVMIGTNVTSIGNSAFSACRKLLNVIIPNSVITIGNDAFERCGSLSNLIIGANVTTVGDRAFWLCGLTSVRIPNNVSTIGDYAFSGTGLTNVTIGTNVTSIGNYAFLDCGSLTNITIPDSVTSIGDFAFGYCTNLASIRIGRRVTTIDEEAFQDCSDLISVYFQGNAPILNPIDFDQFYADANATLYYLPGTTGWSSTFSGRPTVLWNPQIEPASYGVRSNQFGFNITGSSNLVVVIEATTNLTNPTWLPLQTNTLNGSTLYFTDPQWTNDGSRFYRVTWP